MLDRKYSYESRLTAAYNEMKRLELEYNKAMDSFLALRREYEDSPYIYTLGIDKHEARS